MLQLAVLFNVFTIANTLTAWSVIMVLAGVWMWVSGMNRYRQSQTKYQTGDITQEEFQDEIGAQGKSTRKLMYMMALGLLLWVIASQYK